MAARETLTGLIVFASLLSMSTQASVTIDFKPTRVSGFSLSFTAYDQSSGNVVLPSIRVLPGSVKNMNIGSVKAVDGEFYLTNGQGTSSSSSNVYLPAGAQVTLTSSYDSTYGPAVYVYGNVNNGDTFSLEVSR